MPASANRTASTAPSMAPRTSGVSRQPNSIEPATTPTSLMTGGETPWNSAWRIDSRSPGSCGLKATIGPRLRIPFLSRTFTSPATPPLVLMASTTTSPSSPIM